MSEEVIFDFASFQTKQKNGSHFVNIDSLAGWLAVKRIYTYLIIFLLMLRLSQCFYDADHSLKLSNYRVEGGGMYSIVACVWVFLCLWNSFCMPHNIKSTLFELRLCHHAYVTSFRIITNNTESLSPANLPAHRSQLLCTQTIQSVQFMLNIWRVTKKHTENA